jgi:ribonucleoside-triphosphate reductase
MTGKILNKKTQFKLAKETEENIRKTPYQFGYSESGFGEAVFLRTYSRTKPDGQKETWHDTVIRCINGIMTIRKWWYLSHKLHWEEEAMQKKAAQMAKNMVLMKWLPPGRGLAMMGTDFIYERGSMSLYNCSYTEISDLPSDLGWMMEALMYGAGVGFSTSGPPQKLVAPGPDHPTKKHIVSDSREGWVDSLKVLLLAFTQGEPLPEFDYGKIRPFGAALKSFGGTASGPGPLKDLHKRAHDYCVNYANNKPDYTWTRLVCDLANAIGVTVIAGSSRRSAEIALGEMDDPVFINLKNLDLFPDRQDIYWMSNNSIRLRTKEDFLRMPEIAEKIIDSGEPGILNMVNIQRFGRYGEKSLDKATGINPCGEIPLENKEVCNVIEVVPNNCTNKKEFFEALENATFYGSTVSLLPTHSDETNTVVARNRRIGVSLTGIAQWVDTWGMAQCTRWMRDGYTLVKRANKKFNTEAGIPASVRVTTVKPSGTVSQLIGVSSGMHWPVFRYAIRRIIMNPLDPLTKALIKANYTWEPLIEWKKRKDLSKKDVVFERYLAENSSEDPEAMVPCESKRSVVVEFPIALGKARAASGVSAWEQFSLLATLQREWADNSVSCTVYFDKEREKSQVPFMLAQYAPVIKSVSMLPHSDKGVYLQMPYEGISKAKYEELLTGLHPIQWGKIKNSEVDQLATLYCESDRCDLPAGEQK